MMLFGTKEPTEEQRAEGYETDPGYDRKSGKCETFSWIGQDFSHCDTCGKPCWQHPYEPGFGDNAGLRKKMDWTTARAMWVKWGEPKGLPFGVSRPCIAARERT